MPINKYIGTKVAVQLTGLPIQEIYDLIHSGKLPAHKAPKSGWRISRQDLEALGLIRDKMSDHILENPVMESRVSYISDDEHYSKVFIKMTRVKHKLRIASGDLKNFIVTIDSESGEIKLRLCDFFLSLVKRGVQVQVVCMKPFGFYLFAKKNCPELLENNLFELRYNGHNHMKIFVFDEDCAYIGSANITSAAIGKRSNGNRNHEAGLLMSGEMMQEPLRHFEDVWNDPESIKHSWKRFEKKAKELETILKERYEE